MGKLRQMWCLADVFPQASFGGLCFPRASAGPVPLVITPSTVTEVGSLLVFWFFIVPINAKGSQVGRVACVTCLGSCPKPFLESVLPSYGFRVGHHQAG